MSRLRSSTAVLSVAVLALSAAACELVTDPGPDEQAPTIVELGPDNVLTTEPGARIRFEGRAEDDREVARVNYRFFRQGDSVWRFKGGAYLESLGRVTSFAADFVPPREGVYQGVFDAEDAAGNRAIESEQAGSVTFFVDWTAPDVWIAAPAPEMNEWPDSTMDLVVHATDSTSVREVRLSVNGSPFRPIRFMNGYWSGRDPDMLALEPGANSVVVQAVDRAGRIAETRRTLVRVEPRPARFTEIQGTAEDWCGRETDGGWLCLGENRSYRLGIGTTSRPSVPTPLVSDRDLVGLDFGAGDACALARDGTPYCWGRNAVGELGAPSDTPVRLVPGRAAEELRLTTIDPGAYVTCGVDGNGSGWCWGNNGSDQLGAGDTPIPRQCTSDTSCSSTPVRVDVTQPLREIAPSMFFACGVAVAGSVWCWGREDHGAFGNGSDSTANSYTPHPVRVTGDLVFDQIGTGDDTVCGVTRDGEAYCWGDNRDGRVGDGTTEDRDVPTGVASPLLWRSVGFATDELPCGLAEDGTIHCWGMGRTEPTPLSGGLVFTQVARSHACGIATDGGVYCWDESLVPTRVGDAA